MSNGSVFAFMARSFLSRDDKQIRAGFNPRPKGEILNGSTTDEVLRIFDNAEPGTNFTFEMIFESVNEKRSKRAVDWALVFLRETGQIRANPGGDPRNSRYHIYTRVQHE